jgi:hypothetical protein
MSQDAVSYQRAATEEGNYREILELDLNEPLPNSFRASTFG